MGGTLTNSRLAIKGIWLSVQLFYKLGKMHFYLKNQKHRFQGLELVSQIVIPALNYFKGRTR